MLRIIRHQGEAPTNKGRLVADTGSHCPISGIWAPAGEQESGRVVLEGSIMPARGSVPVDWQLVQGLTRRDLHS
jgi:hypothetical protein